MAPIEEVLPAEGQSFTKEVGNTRTEQAQEAREQKQKQAPATGGDGDEAQNQINTTA